VQPVYNIQANIIVDAIPDVIDRMWAIVRENAALAEEMARPQAPPGVCV
jgi:serine/threonine protein kinase HipA of HipAB toxin-antitoxin module